MTTYPFRKVVLDLKEFCNDHALIRQVYYEREYQMEGSTKADYPAAVIERVPIDLLPGENIFSLSVSVVDMPLESQDDLLTIHNKILLFFEDLYARFRLGKTAQYTILNQPNAEPISVEKNDRIDGWSATFDFSVRADGDGCEFPTHG